ncbi:MAG: DUF4150 domain-containing protein [Thermodesulfobacteriota bacterium]|nr:DUF4150 domain-containing protein [Thermodesulfobacteriota bacterium]
MGIAKSTLPDVCKTPSPGGPVPIPYPVIVSMSSDLKKGTKTVKVDGKKMAAIKGAEFSRCMGDEPGTAGGVKSSTNMKEATWLLYSFDVKLDGKNACRLTDKMMMNHQNTACLAGIQQIPVIPGGLTAEQKVACAIYCCDNAKYKKKKHKPSKTKSGAELDCISLSTTKHSCVLHSLRKKTKSGKLTQKSKYKDIIASPSNLKVGGKKVIPDIIIYGNSIIDCKFPCKKPAAPLKGEKHKSDMSKRGTDMLTDKENYIYPKIKVKGQKVKRVRAMTPKDAQAKKGDKCKCRYKDV